jgi:hypothetical protein
MIIFIILLILFIASISDIKSHTVYKYMFYPVFFIDSYFNNLFIIVFIFFILIDIFNITITKMIANADIKAIISITLFCFIIGLFMPFLYAFLIVNVIFIIIFHKSNNIPYIPVVFIAYIIAITSGLFIA